MSNTLLSKAALSVLLLAALAAPAFPADAPKQLTFINGVPDTGQFLPNDQILATVGDRKIRVIDFRVGFFSGRPEIRSSSDSLGRAELLTNMIRKDVLGLKAPSAGYQLNFEDRAQLREVRNTTLSNRLFEREVLAAPPVSEDSLRLVYGYLGYDVRARILVFASRAEAESARDKLAKQKLRWEALLPTNTPAAYAATKGEVPWTRFETLPMDMAMEIWPLPVGKISKVLGSATGYQVVQVLERRPRKLPAYEFTRQMIVGRFADRYGDMKRRAITNEAKIGMEVRYDSANVVWASRQFAPAVQLGAEQLGQNIMIDENVPEIAPADTSRTLLEYKGGRISVGLLLREYSEIPTVMRPTLTTPERVADYADAIMLAPRMVDLAIQRGLENDPVYKRAMKSKEEELLVTKMVEDSVLSRIMVTSQERRAFYEKNRNHFATSPSIRYAVIVRDTKAEAEAVKARLDKGEKPGDIVHADSLRGEVRSGIKEQSSDEHDVLHKLLFEEMRPGQNVVLGPDAKKMFACFALLSYDPGRQMAYTEVEAVVDESVRNQKGEQALNAFVDRLKKGIPITARYDLLMKVMLTTPDDSEIPND